MRLLESYLNELNFKYGDFGKILNFKKPKSRFAPVSIPFVIPRFTAHWLRHTYITMLYFAGVDVLTAKEQAGHSDINTTIPVPNSNTKPVAVHTDIHDEYKKVKRFSLVG